jgi:hypothetical protein
MFFFPRRIAFISTLAFICLAPSMRAQTDQQRAPRVEGIRFWSFGDVTRIAVETTGDYTLYSEQIEKPDRIYFDLTGLEPPSAAQHSMQTIPVGDHRIRQIRVARVSATKTRIVFDLECPVEVVSSQLVNPDRLMIEIRPNLLLPPTRSICQRIVQPLTAISRTPMQSRSRTRLFRRPRRQLFKRQLFKPKRLLLRLKTTLPMRIIPISWVRLTRLQKALRLSISTQRQLSQLLPPRQFPLPRL